MFVAPPTSLSTVKKLTVLGDILERGKIMSAVFVVDEPGLAAWKVAVTLTGDLLARNSAIYSMFNGWNLP